MSVKIPAGVQDGAVRTVRGAGEASPSWQRRPAHQRQRHRPRALPSATAPTSWCRFRSPSPRRCSAPASTSPRSTAEVVMKVPPRDAVRQGVSGCAARESQSTAATAKAISSSPSSSRFPQQVSRRQRKLIADLAQEIGDDAHPAASQLSPRSSAACSTRSLAATLAASRPSFAKVRAMRTAALYDHRPAHSSLGAPRNDDAPTESQGDESPAAGARGGHRR